MEILVEVSEETKRRSQRWQVSYASKPGKRDSGRETRVYRNSVGAVRKVKSLVARGISSKVEPVLTDFYVVNHCGGIVLCHAGMLPREAAKIAYDYSSIDRIAGILLWPHGLNLPKSLQKRVIIADESEVVS